MTGLVVSYGGPRPCNSAFIDAFALGSDQKEIFASPDVPNSVNANEVLMRVNGHRPANVDGDAGHCRVCSTSDRACVIWTGC